MNPCEVGVRSPDGWAGKAGDPDRFASSVRPAVERARPVVGATESKGLVWTEARGVAWSAGPPRVENEAEGERVGEDAPVSLVEGGC
jgi:hypothetical protein